MLSSEKLNQIEHILSYEFSDKTKLNSAFTHSSYGNLNLHESNERLEFLGDSVLHLVSTRYLYQNFDLPEGVLSKLRAFVVSTKHLSKKVEEMGLVDFLQYEKGTTNQPSEAIKANLFEAILAAIYLDGGFEAAYAFATKTLGYSKELFERLIENPKDYKTTLQEVIQAKKQHLLEYHTVKKEGPPHKPIFTVEVLLNGQIVGTGKAKSKKEAENLAAQQALENLSE